MVPLSGSDVSAQDIEQLLRTLGASPVYAGFTPAVTALQYVLADQQLLTHLLPPDFTQKLPNPAKLRFLALNGISVQ